MQSRIRNGKLILEIGHNSGFTSSMQSVKAIAKRILKDSISNYMSKQKVTTSSPIDLLFPNERRIRSVMGGLETSLGVKFWERVAREIALSNNFEVLNVQSFNESVPVIPKEIMHKLSDFEERKKKVCELTHQDYFSEILSLINRQNIQVTEKIKIGKGSGIDIWFKKDNIEYLIDIKTVQINAGSGVKFNRNLLEWYTYQALKKVERTRCMIAFPYNPHKENYWKKEHQKVAPLIPGIEAKVEDEFWDFLSGNKGTYDQIKKAFIELSNEGFANKFKPIFYQ